MERREKALISKSELQEGRLQQKPTLSRGPVGRPGSRAGNNANAERLKMLKSKKERLNHTLERLALQAGHKVWIPSPVRNEDLVANGNTINRRGS